ncbi:methionine--tRNA ligase [Patescibacteria group bacterium]
MKKKIFITTAIDYTNDVIHIGHAYEKILSDSYARYERVIKNQKNVLYTTGTDEHGTTNQKAAEERGLEPKDHVDDISKKDKAEIDSLNISYDRFIRTTDKDHIKIASAFFQKAFDNGDIYKDSYKGFYCEGCESYKTLSELDENKKCKNHPTREIQELDEENYFFKWSKYEDFLKDLIESNKLVIKPEGKRSEMLAFLREGLRDITVTRPKYKVSWGITAPNDDEQVIYVWFDALINYFTEGSQKDYWNDDTKIVHFVGKDIARWHTLLWPAMLKSAGYRIPDVVYVHGFLNLEGEKISKSLGNVIRPTELVEQYGTDAVRYYLLKFGPIVEDSDLSHDHFKEVYNGELANGLGNTVARLAKLAEKSEIEFPVKDFEIDEDVFKPMEDYRADRVIQNIWTILSDLDKHINENEPWGIKDKKKLEEILSEELGVLRKVAKYIEPFMPETAKKIQKQLDTPNIKADKPLFPRI